MNDSDAPTAAECLWCDRALLFDGRGLRLCEACRSAYRSRCLRVAGDIWQSIPWDRNPDLALSGQYIETRFLVELDDVVLQRVLHGQWLALSGRRSMNMEEIDVKLNIDKLSLDDARKVVGWYAPRRDLSDDIYKSAKQMIEVELSPVGGV